MGLLGAILALAIGPAIDRMGAKRMLLLAVSLLGVHAFLIAQTQHLWQNTLYVRAMLSIWVMMLPVIMVSALALAMAICKSVNSATQFAIYMSVANFGHSAGSKIYGLVAEKSSYVQSYTMLSALFVALIIAILLHRHHHHRDAETHGTRPDGKKRERPRYTVGIGGNEAGIFWTGAMRCPKCRADMEPVEYEGTEVDRCTICHGIWFDAGEIEILKDKKAAAAIDIGDEKIGKQSSAIDRYDCPRCGGAMVRVIDPVQNHIWYETCGGCNGSYLDAGELRDLSTRSISDFFKSLATPERK
jgi:Zn-finger nucleic acid-binding protein